MTDKKCKAGEGYIIYTIFFVITIVIGFFYVFIERRSLIGHDDAFNQYFCVFYYCGRWIRNLFDGNFRLYDTSIGLGESVIGALNYYGFGDVLLLPFVLFPEEYLHYGYTLSIVFRMYLAGISFMFYCANQKESIPCWASILASLSYVFSTYTMTEGLLFHEYVTVLFWLPLIALGVERLIDDNQYKENEAEHTSFLLIISVFCLSLIGFYFIYMVILYIAVKVIIHFICNNRGVVTKSVSVVVHFALGMGSACFILLPATKYFLDSPRNSQFSLISVLCELPSREVIQNGIRNIVTPPESIYDYLSFSLPIVFLISIVLLLTHKEINKRKELITGTILCVYGYFFPTIGTIMNGGTRHYDRWLFIAFFFFSVMLVRTIPVLIHSYTMTDEILSWCLAFIWLISYYVTSDNTEIKVQRMCIYSIIWIATLTLMHFMKRRTQMECGKRMLNIFFLIIFFNICLNTFLMTAPKKFGGNEVKEIFIKDVRARYTETPLYWEAEANDNTKWVRYDIINAHMMDEALVCGTNPSSGSYSITNGDIWKFLGDFGIDSSFRGLDSRQALESLLCVYKYDINGWGLWTTEQNDYCLPLGIVFDGYIDADEYRKLSPLEKQNTILEGVILDTEQGKNTLKKDVVTGEISDIPIQIEYECIDNRQGSTISVNNSSVMRLKFLPDDVVDGKMCELFIVLDFKEVSNGTSVSVGETRIRLEKGDNKKIVCVDYLNNKGAVDIKFGDSTDIRIEDIRLVKSYNTNLIADYSFLNKHCMNNANWEGDKYIGVTEEEKDGFLFLSLPFINGWECTIDGVKADILNADTSFMAVFLPAGKHYVEFSYHTPWLREGIIISVMSIITVAWLLLKRKNKILLVEGYKDVEYFG